MDPVLTFVIPIPHPDNVSDWAQLKSNLQETLRSIAQQTDPRWRALIVANEGSQLPTLPAQVELVSVDFPANTMADRGAVDDETFFQAIRLDKGRRLLAGVLHARPSGHYMAVDDDDFVSARLTSYVATHPEQHGWFVREGYVWKEGGKGLYLHDRFHHYCGTSHIVHSRLLDLPASMAEASDDYIRRTFGSHLFIRDKLAAAGTPLSALPFTGAVWRVGHGGSVSRSKGLLRTFFLNRGLLRHPLENLKRVRRLRVLTDGVRREFFGSLPA